MQALIAWAKAVGGTLFNGFMHSRLLAELPGADDLIQRPIDHHSVGPRAGGAIPGVGVL